MQDEFLNVVVRILPWGIELDVCIPANTTGLVIKERIIRYLQEQDEPLKDPRGIPKSLSSFQLVSKVSGKVISNNRNLYECNVRHGDTLLFTEILVAGGFFGNMIYSLPQKFRVAYKKYCRIRIAKKRLEALALVQGLEEAQLKEIEINELMKVQLEENSLDQHLHIQALNSEEQLISDDFFTEWIFELTPLKKGVTAIILRIIMPEILAGFGEKHKDVCIINKVVEITSSEEDDHDFFIQDFVDIYHWTPQFRDEIYKLISTNETGKALAKIADFFQKVDPDILHATILLQAQWNHGKNNYTLNLLSDNEWLMLQTKINHGILEIVKNIEDRKWTSRRNMAIMQRLQKQMKGLL